jgi:hypothetical protein
MTCLADNFLIEVNPNPGAFFTAVSDARTSEKKEVKNDSLREIKQRPGLVGINLKPEQYIAFQMSFIPEVEQVYVAQHNHGELHVVTVVNDRDRILNRKIFARQDAIIDYFRHLRFDFHIIPRMNRSVGDILAIPGTRVK